MALNQQLASVKGEVHAARDEQIRAAHRLEQLQAKLVHGGENLLDKSARLAAEEAAKAEQLAEQRAREQARRRAMAHVPPPHPTSLPDLTPHIPLYLR